MKYLILPFLLLIANSPLFAQNLIPNELIIWLEKDISITTFTNSHLNKSNTLQYKKTLSKTLNIHLFEATNPSQIIDFYTIHPFVKYIQPNRTTSYRSSLPNDPLFNFQTNLDLIQAEAVWDSSTGGLTANNDTIVVAVIDRGVDFTHEDLIGNLWFNQKEIDNDGIDNDNNGYIDDYKGWDFVKENDEHIPTDHGTPIASIIGAKGNNNTGLSGINWNIKLMVLSQVPSEAEVVEAYNYVLEMRKKYNETNGQEGAFVVATNSSFGIARDFAVNYPIWCSMYDELGAVGILNAGATSNDNDNVDLVGDIPTTCTSPYLITVTNTNQSDERVASGFGKTSIDLSAPGEGTPAAFSNNLYTNFGGTSGACPHVAGAIALLYSTANPALIEATLNNPSDAILLVKNAILGGVDPLPQLEDITVSEGRLNLYKSWLELEKCLNNEVFGAFKLSTYPNPVSTELIIDYTFPNEGIRTIEVFNSIGQKVETISLSTDSCSDKLYLNPRQWGQGVFYLVLKEGKDRIIRKVVVP